MIALIITLCCLILSGCSGGKSTDQTTVAKSSEKISTVDTEETITYTTTTTTTTETTTQDPLIEEDTTELQTEPAAEVDTEASEVGDKEFIVSLKSATIVKDYSNDPVLAVTYVFSHNKEKPTSFMLAVSDTAYQNGIECSSAVFAKEVDSSTQMTEIKSGVEYEVEAGYKLNDTTSNVDIVINPLFSFTDNKPIFEFEFNIADGNVTQIQKEEFVEETDFDNSSSNSDKEISVKFKSGELSTDYKGDPILVVTYLFSHQKEEPTAFMYVVSDKAYQNGIECNDIVISDSVDSSTQMNKIKAGVEYEVIVGYKLNDTTSDVELVVEPLFSFIDKEPICEYVYKF